MSKTNLSKIALQTGFTPIGEEIGDVITFINEPEQKLMSFLVPEAGMQGKYIMFSEIASEGKELTDVLREHSTKYMSLNKLGLQETERNVGNDFGLIAYQNGEYQGFVQVSKTNESNVFEIVYVIVNGNYFSGVENTGL